MIHLLHSGIQRRARVSKPGDPLERAAVRGVSLMDDSYPRPVGGTDAETFSMASRAWERRCLPINV